MVVKKIKRGEKIECYTIKLMFKELTIKLSLLFGGIGQHDGKENKGGAGDRTLFYKTDVQIIKYNVAPTI